MTKIKKNKLRITNYGLLITLLAVSCGLLITTVVQSQRPQIEITLTWSTDTYVPLDYPGKALPSRGSAVEITANIDSPGINPQELIYNWFLNDAIQKAGSGQGKQVFRFNIGESITKVNLIKVEVSNREKTVAAVSSYLPLKPVEPEIILKTKARFLTSLNLEKNYLISGNQEIEFFAQPYFFNINNVNELNYSWGLGGKTALKTSSANPNVFILKIGKLVQIVKKTLLVWVENRNNLIQRTQTGAEITLIP